MKTGKAGYGLIRRWEGCKLTAYPDPATGGEPWTIGYGITTAAGLGTIYKGMTISQQQADDWLSAGLVPYEEAVLGALKREPTQEQFDAMVSLCWNIGPGNFRSSTVVREFNKGNTQAAADAFLKWNRANGKVMKGLTNRRKDERSVFLDA